MALLEAVLGPEGRRRLELRNKSNDELFTLYDADLLLRVRNARNLNNERQLLAKFQQYLNGERPSAELAKVFLSYYAGRKPATLARYAATIKSFMKWYGEPIDNFRVRVPKTLPPYTEDSDVDKLRQAISDKKTHRGKIIRDRLLVDLGLDTGMRRGELADLEPRDIHADFLVAHGKGKKDRVIPLLPAMAARLHDFTKDMKPDEKVFKLKPASIGNKIRSFANKAGLKNFHTHTMRHKFATDLLERGGDIRAVQELLGHADLSNTQIYLSITDKRIRETVDLLGGPPRKKRGQSGNDAADGIQPVVY
jgi:integrase/recombinase XerD